MFRLLFASLLCILPLFSLENSIGALGYGRLQTSFEDGKENTCFQAPGAGSKYRLGNECESWIELGSFQDLTFDNGITVHNQVRPLFMGANEEAIDFFDWGEAYSEISNLFDNSVKLWIGRRYYDRYESHISDYWPLNMSGDGIGIRGIELGGIGIAYALMIDSLNPTVDSTQNKADLYSHDLRLSQKNGSAETILFLNYITLQAQTFDQNNRIGHTDGKAVGLLYKEKSLFEKWFDAKGENVSGLFYGEGLAKDTGEYLPFMSRQFERDALIDNLITNASIGRAKTWRVINYNAFETPLYGIMSNLLYEVRDENAFAGIKQEWFSAGVRPYWFFHKNRRLLLEAGYDGVNDQVAKKQYNLIKMTVAAELAMEKGIWERPVVRLFYTAARWSDDAKGQVGGDSYAKKTTGDNAGIQLEYWW